MCAHAYNVRKWRPTQQTEPGRAENSFIDQDKFVAMKTLSGCKAPCCDENQFCDKMTVRT